MKKKKPWHGRGRNFNDPKYKKWRQAVYRRDGYRCQFPECGISERINAHHIKTWADWPALRFVLQNGITLCGRHHSLVKGKENIYQEIFLRVLAQNILKRIKGFHNEG